MTKPNVPSDTPLTAFVRRVANLTKSGESIEGLMREASLLLSAEWVARQPDESDSCLVCGRVGRSAGTWSALCPSIYVCVKCRDAALAATEEQTK